MTTETSERLHALDAVRGFALLAGVAFHAIMSFLPGPQVWPVEDSERSPFLAGLFFVLHVFRMTTFFLIAGFFARMSFKRRGLGGFVGDRLKRIALPLVVFWPLIIASIIAVSIWAAAEANGGVVPKGPPPPGMTAQTFPLTHLWFLYVLLIFYAAILLLRAPMALVDRGGALRRAVDCVVRAMVRSPVWPFVLAAPLAAALWMLPKWYWWFGVPTPDTGFLPNPATLTGYGTAFVLGWLLQRQPDLLSVLRGRWALHLGFGAVMTAISLAIGGVTPVFEPAVHDPRTALFTACYTLAIWGMTFGVIGAALRFASGHSPVRRYIADASYWIYLVHLPVIMALQVLAARLDWPWEAKYPAVLGGGLLLTLVSYQLLVRHSFVGRILNGRRKPKPEKGAAPAAPTPTAMEPA